MGGDEGDLLGVARKGLHDDSTTSRTEFFYLDWSRLGRGEKEGFCKEKPHVL